MTLGERESLDFGELDQNRLVDILYSQEHLSVKNEVAQVLGKVKLLNEATLLFRISELLIDQRDEFRSVGVRALKQIELSDGETLMYIVPLLKDRAASTRLAALKVRLRSTELSDPSIFYNDLIDLLKDADRADRAVRAIRGDENAVRAESAVRALSMRIIGEINPPKKGIHRKLVASLADPSIAVRDKTIRTLGIIQPKDPTTLFSIANLLMHRNKLVRMAAVGCFGRVVNLNNKSVLTFIASILVFGDTWTSNQQNNNSNEKRREWDETFGYRLSAAQVLRQIGPRDKEVQLLWVRGLRDSDSRVRIEVERGLEELRPFLIPEVLEMIFDYDLSLYERIIDQTPQEVFFDPLSFDL